MSYTASSRSLCQDEVNTNLTIFREGCVRTHMHSFKTALGTQRPAGVPSTDTSASAVHVWPSAGCRRARFCVSAVFRVGLAATAGRGPHWSWGWGWVLLLSEAEPPWPSPASTVISGSTLCPLRPYTLGFHLRCMFKSPLLL